jgi:hypothetical protein
MKTKFEIVSLCLETRDDTTPRVRESCSQYDGRDSSSFGLSSGGGKPILTPFVTRLWPHVWRYVFAKWLFHQLIIVWFVINSGPILWTATIPNVFFLCYSPKLSESVLYSVGDGVYNEHGAVGGMRIGRVNQNTRRNHTALSFCPLQIPYDLTWDQTRPAAVWTRWLTAGDMFLM